MPFDPNLPASGSQISSAELRTQFQSLRDLITAPIAAVVDNVTTQPPENGASASVSLDGAGTLHFSFSLPQGQTGSPGEVSQAQLANDLSNSANATILTVLPLTSANSNNVPTLDTAMAGYLELLRLKLNELITALRR